MPRKALVVCETSRRLAAASNFGLSQRRWHGHQQLLRAAASKLTGSSKQHSRVEMKAA